MQFNRNPTWQKMGQGRAVGLEIELAFPGGYDAGIQAIETLPENFERDRGYVGGAKVDGSVFGVEFVTQPASLAIHRRNLGTVFRHLRSLGFSANNTCGLHVHVERKPEETNDSLLCRKLMVVCNMESEPWARLFREIYGRVGRNWAHAVANRGARFLDDLAEAGRRLSEAANEKYLRCNIQHRGTFEFRQGHGTTLPSRALLRAEASIALVRFLSTHSVDTLDALGGPGQEVTTFLLWASERADRYPKLHQFAVARLGQQEETLLA